MCWWSLHPWSIPLTSLIQCGHYFYSMFVAGTVFVTVKTSSTNSIFLIAVTMIDECRVFPLYWLLACRWTKTYISDLVIMYPVPCLEPFPLEGSLHRLGLSELSCQKIGAWWMIRTCETVAGWRWDRVELEWIAGCHDRAWGCRCQSCHVLYSSMNNTLCTCTYEHSFVTYYYSFL